MALGRHLVAALTGRRSWTVPLLLTLSPVSVFGQADVTKHPGTPDPVYLIIRTDDAGFSHSVNRALQRLIDTGLPLSVVAVVSRPRYQETVELLKGHPEVAI